MKTHPIIICCLLAGVLTLLNSCTERINIDLDNTYTRLVVEGKLTTDTTRHLIKLNQTADYFENEPAPPVKDARVTINDSIVLQEASGEPGHYYTDPGIYGVIGKTYTLTIENVDINKDGTHEQYTATSRIKTISRADSIDLVYRRYAEQAQFWEVQLYAQDPPEANYYIFKVHKNDTLVTDTLNEWMVQDDEMFNGNYVPGVAVQFLDEDKKDEVVRKNDTITLEINSISNAYHQYFHEVLAETRPGNPLFSGPPANVSTNITTHNGPGAVGFFATYSISRISMVIENTDKQKEARKAF